MGSDCCSEDRKKQAADYYAAAAEYSTKTYAQASDAMATNLQQAAKDYGPTYEIAKMKTLGYTLEDVKDNGKCKFITEFEKGLPFR